MKIRFLVLTLFLLAASTAFAQDARAILDRAAQAYANAGGISAGFTLDAEDLKSKQTYSQDGTAYMLGDKFKIDIPDGTTWFDGKTQWIYVKDTEEVNISNPSKEELQSISPSAVFGIYKSGFDFKYNGTKTVNGIQVDVVLMTAQAKMRLVSDILSITVHINKKTNIFTMISVANKSGFKNTIHIKNIKIGLKLDNTKFQFNTKDYPEVEIIDLR